MYTNILLKGLCKLKTPSIHEPAAMANNYQLYAEMHHLSIESYNKNLIGDWRLVELNDEQDNILLYFKNLLILIKKTWHENYPCNIIYADADTLCIKALDIFGKFSDFRIFTDDDFPKSGDYFNGGIKYYPSTLTDDFWREIQLIIDNWDLNSWEYEQKSQVDLMLKRPEFNSQKSQNWVVRQIGVNHKKLLEELNQPTLSSINQSILHLHSSQNPQFRLQCMKHIWSITNDKFK